MREDFAVFILTHGRPDNVRTFETLKKQGYTGKIFFILDDEDETINKYIENFGQENIIVFNKKLAAKAVDTPDLSEDRRAIVYARNSCFDIAAMLGLRYFLQLDDDYICFHHRFAEEGRLKSQRYKNLDKVFEYMIDFLNDSNALTIAFAQGGDFMGGAENDFFRNRIKRKAMNTFFCDVQKPFSFVGRINEDVNTYTLLGNQGELIMSVADANIVQLQTQSSKGGMTDIYLDKGTYMKSFYFVVYSPQCVKVAEMGRKYRRLHHQISWNHCASMILSERYKKH